MNFQNVPNRLIESNSPYLRMHAGNRSIGRNWARRLLRRRGSRTSPSSVYWVQLEGHLMYVSLVPRDDAGIFEDAEVALLLHANFVPVKVDREERPTWTRST